MTLPDPERVRAQTLDWLEKAVIGLNLCPFAKAVVVHDRVGYVVSRATTPEALAEELEAISGAEEAVLTRLDEHRHRLAGTRHVGPGARLGSLGLGQACKNGKTVQ